jgi:hypothetical protein
MNKKELEKVLFDYVMSVNVPDDDDEWDEITAVETPQALKSVRSKHRSGEYLKEEFSHAVIESIKRCGNE